MRPISIVNFERCYLGAVLVGLVNSLLIVPVLLRTPQMAQVTATLGTNFFYYSKIVTLTFSLLLWYFTARRASAVAKWIVVVLFAFSMLATLRALVTGFPTPLLGVLGVVAFVLQALAVYLLFRPDAVAWFRRDAVDLNDTFA